MRYRPFPGARVGTASARPRSPESFTSFVWSTSPSRGRREARAGLGGGRFDYPWIYATQVGFWDLSDGEIARLREYLLRGGFLMTDDFYGLDAWEVFRKSMQRVFPERSIVEIDESHEAMHCLAAPVPLSYLCREAETEIPSRTMFLKSPR